MEKKVCDFLVFLGNPPKELGDAGAVFRVEKRGVMNNDRVRFDDLRAVDLAVRQSAGGFLRNSLFGRPNIVNGLEIDKVRQCVVPASLIFPLKLSGDPQVFAVLPDDFNDLSPSFRDNSVWGQVFNLGFTIFEKETSARTDLQKYTRSKSEIDDLLSGSVQKALEFVKETNDTFVKDVDAKVNNLKKERQGNEDEHFMG